MIKVSVVIPAYNAGKYIADTLHCLNMQTATDFEVVIVDDNSTDDTVEKCNAFARNTQRDVRLYKNSGKGVSSARNYGVSKARGAYIAFLDADDLVHPECYQILLENMENNDVDAVACAFDTFLDGTTPEKDRPIEHYQSLWIEGGDRAAESMVSADKSVSVRGYVWNKLYKRALLEQVRFDENLTICEDSLFSWQIMKAANRLQLLQVPLYHYRKRNDSSTVKADFEKNHTAVEAYARMIRDVLTEQVNLREPYRRELFRQYIYWILRTAESDGAGVQKLSGLRKYMDDVPDTFEMKGLPFERKVKWNALKSSPETFVRVKKGWDFYKNAKRALKALVKRT